MTRVHLLFKVRRPYESNAARIVRMITTHGKSRDYIVTIEQEEWLRESNILDTRFGDDQIDYYLDFVEEQDALAFRLRFGL